MDNILGTISGTLPGGNPGIPIVESSSKEPAVYSKFQTSDSGKGLASGYQGRKRGKNGMVEGMQKKKRIKQE